jgi:hypothetical protein
MDVQVLTYGFLRLDKVSIPILIWDLVCVVGLINDNQCVGAAVELNGYADSALLSKVNNLES